jgi:hypothetical protein
MSFRITNLKRKPQGSARPIEIHDSKVFIHEPSDAVPISLWGKEAPSVTEEVDAVCQSTGFDLVSGQARLEL